MLDFNVCKVFLKVSHFYMTVFLLKRNKIFILEFK